MPDDIITPQDTLEPVSQLATPVTPVPSVSGPAPVAPEAAPSQTPNESPQMPSYMSGLVANKLLRKLSLSSGALILVIGLLVGATILYQKTHKVELTQAQQVAQIKDQSVSLKDQLPNNDNKANLRQGINTLYVNGDLSAQGQLNLGNGSVQAQLSPSALTNSQNYLLPNASGTICLSSNNCDFATAKQVTQLIQSQGAGSTGVASLQGTAGQVLVAGTGGRLTLSLPQSVAATSSPTFQNLNVNGSVTQNGSLVCDASNNCGFASVNSTLLQGGNQFGTALALGTLDGNAVNILTNGSVVASFSASGQAVFRNSSDAGAGLQVQNAAGDSLFTVDTANNQVVLGSSANIPTVLTLGVGTTSSDPAGTDGQMYYNSALGKFRCYQNGTWTNCVGASGSGTGDVNNGGNNYGSMMILGTLDNNPLAFLVNGNLVGGFVADAGGALVLQNYENSAAALMVLNAQSQTILNVSTLTGDTTLSGGILAGTNRNELRLVSAAMTATTPSATTNQLTGDIDIIARITPAFACNNNTGIVALKNNSYGLFYGGNSCSLGFMYSHDGTNTGYVSSTAGVSNGSTGTRWVRVTLDASTGTVTFYANSDQQDQEAIPTSWQQLGSTVTIPAGSLYPSTSPVQIGGGNYQGYINQVYILDGIGGTPVIFFNAADGGGSTGWTVAKGSITQTWTVNGGAQIVGADSSFGGPVNINSTNTTSLLSVNTPTTLSTTATGQAVIATGAAANQALILQASSGQTADLFQNQTSSGIAVSGFGASGNLYTNGLTANLNALVSPSFLCYGLFCSSASSTGGSLAAGTYYYTITAVNASGTEAIPAATTTLTATANTSSVNLYWITSVGAVKYKIYRSTSPTFSSPSLLATVDGNSSSYTDTGGSVTTGAPPSSTTGSGLNIQVWNGQSSSALQVQNSAGVTLAGVSGKGGLFTNGTNSTLSALKAPVITGLSPGYGAFGGDLPIDTYYYAVTAVNSTGETTVDQATNYFTTTQNNGAIRVNWTLVPGATSYRIYRSSASTGGAEFGTNSLLTTVDGTTSSFVDYNRTTFSAGRPKTTTAGSGLTLQGWDGQTSNLLQMQDSSGTTLSKFTSNGSLSITGGATISQRVGALSLDGLANSFNVSTPDAPANRITGSIMVTSQMTLKSWANGSTYQTIAGKYDGTAANSAWLFRISPTGYLDLKYSVGGTIYQAQSTAALSAPAGSTLSVSFSRDASGNINFYTLSSAGVQALGSTISGQAGALNAGNQPLQVGAWGSADSAPMLGSITRLYVNIGGIGSAVVVDMYPAMATIGATSWTSSTTGEVWTLGGTATLVSNSAQLTVAANDSSVGGIVLQAASGQTADMLQVNSQSGARLFRVAGDGSIATLASQNGIGGYGTSGVTLKVSSRAIDVGLVVFAASGQTADLQQWQDNGGNVLASVSTTGEGSFSNLLQNGNQVCDDSNNCNYLSGDTSSYLQNGVIYFDGTSLVSTAAGSNGQCLSATAGTPTWVACGAGGSGTGDVNNGGNSYGSTMSLGTTDNYGLNFITNNHIVAQFSNSGQATFQNSSDSSTGFQIQNAAGTSLFTADTANSVIYIGNPTPDAIGTLLVLDTKNTTGDPTGINGAMYYNDALGKFRCYQDSTWQDCIYTAQTVAKSASQSFSSTSYSNVNDLSFAIVAGKNYRLACQLVMTIPSGAGAYLSTSAPGGNFTASFFKTGDQAAGDNYATSTTLEDPSPTAVSKITSQTGTRFLLNYNALLTGVTGAGNWQLVIRSAGGTVTVGANSSCTLQPL